MQTIDDTLTLLRRQAELESAMKNPGGIRITEEQELHTIPRQLERFPEKPSRPSSRPRMRCENPSPT